MNDDADMFDAAEKQEALNADRARTPEWLEQMVANPEPFDIPYVAQVACEECGATPCQCDIRRADWERSVYARVRASEEASDARAAAGNTLARRSAADDWNDSDIDA